MRYNCDMPLEVSQDETKIAPRRRRRRQFSLRQLLSAVGGASTLFNAIYWVPGFGGVLLLLIGWFVPAAAVLGALILLQWPMMIVAVRLSDANRNRLRAERRAFLVQRSRHPH